MSFFDKFPYTNFHELNLDWIISQIKTINVNMMKAVESAKNAKVSEDNAKTSETNAKTSETNAKTSEDKAKASETNAKASEDKAKDSETNAKASENKAKASADNAFSSQNQAKLSETKAETAATNAHTSELKASTSEVRAQTSATKAKNYEDNARMSATRAEDSASQAESVASSVAATVYYYDTGEIDCTQGYSVKTMPRTMRVILRNGFMYIYGTLATNTTETPKSINSTYTQGGGIIPLKYNALDVKRWVDEKLPNIDWDNLCGSCSLHGSGFVPVLDRSTSQQLSAMVPIDMLGGIHYDVYVNNSTHAKTYRLEAQFEHFLGDFVNKSVKYDASNIVAKYAMVIPLKFK